jgi:hypothetical protein
MHPAEVTEVLHRLERNGIEAWLGGVWAEAALGAEDGGVRSSLELLVEERNAEATLDILEAAGWSRAEGAPPAPFAVTDGSGARVDVTTRASIEGRRGTLDGRSVRVAF